MRKKKRKAGTQERVSMTLRRDCLRRTPWWPGMDALEIVREQCFQGIGTLFPGHWNTVSRASEHYFQGIGTLFPGHRNTVSRASEHCFHPRSPGRRARQTAPETAILISHHIHIRSHHITSCSYPILSISYHIMI
jgi:hypothetical protein